MGDRDTLREAVARIVHPPLSLTDHMAQIEYNVRCGASEATAMERQNRLHRTSCEIALAKADAILALIPLSEVEEVLGAVIRCDDQAPDYGMCDQRDSVGEAFRSADLDGAIQDARALLSKLKALRGEVERG